MFYSKVEDEMELKKDKLVRFNLKDIPNPVNFDQVVRSKPGNFDKLGGPLAGSSKVLPEDHIPWEKGILDPGSDVVLKWNRVFLMSCLVALAVDPLYFYFPSIGSGSNETSCVKLDRNLAIIATFFRTIADVFYLLHMVMKFRTAYVAPSSRVLGRGELIMNRKRIAMRYLKSDFLVDLMATLPLPQIIIWIVIPMAKSSNAGYNNNTLAMIIFFQYIPRLYLIFPLSNKIIKATGLVTKTAWAGAAYNLLLYMLASHVLGASWYLLSIERQNICWKAECRLEFLNQTSPQCRPRYLDCGFLNPEKEIWTKSTSVFKNCDANDDNIPFQFGIFGDAISKGVVSVNFLEKYLYCLWWGLQNLSSYGQNLKTTTFIGETTFAILIAILGLVLFAHLIGNMQAYMQSITVRLEEWRLKRRDTEEWMSHRQLPPELRNRVRKFNQYKWLATRGVDEESVLQSLPSDLRRDIQRHLCLDLVRRVPYFSQMDDQLLDAICERLVSSLSTEGTYIVREGDPVSEMFFIIRGRLESSTTGGGRTGFFNSIMLRPGAFCGEELLSWALLPNSSVNLPTSTRTVRALVEVEAFALSAEDLRFVSNQFRRLHSKKLQHTFRFYSPHWRTWATCFIQAAWRRYTRRKMAKEGLQSHDSFSYRSDEGADDVHYGEEEHETFSTANPSNNLGNIGVTFLASKFAAQTRKGAQKAKTDEMLKLQKPEEPDFSVDDENNEHEL